MKNTFGNNISITLFGESHGEYIGAVLDGVCAGVKIDEEYIEKNKIKTKHKKSRERGFCRDIRLYTNTINKAVKLMRESGIKSSSEKTEDETSIIYKITINIIRKKYRIKVDPYVKKIFFL